MHDRKFPQLIFNSNEDEAFFQKTFQRDDFLRDESADDIDPHILAPLIINNVQNAPVDIPP